jgi:hypothetical protein
MGFFIVEMILEVFEWSGRAVCPKHSQPAPFWRVLRALLQQHTQFQLFNPTQTHTPHTLITQIHNSNMPPSPPSRVTRKPASGAAPLLMLLALLVAAAACGVARAQQGRQIDDTTGATLPLMPSYTMGSNVAGGWVVGGVWVGGGEALVFFAAHTHCRP